MSSRKCVTAAMLRAWHACESQVRVFEAEWPQGAALTLRNARRAAVLGLDLNWLARQVLTPSALAAYEAVRAPALAAYEAACAPAWAAYEAVRAPALAAYCVACAPALAAYGAACARALFRAIEKGSLRWPTIAKQEVARES